jgi:putative CocE/NonD family hydrolase
MRDGVALSSDVYLPSNPGRYPALLHRTPYDNTSPFFVEQAHYFARQGYAYVFQDVRGRGDSEGEFDAPMHLEGKDGYDTIEWIAAQEWCNGKVGMLGGSFAGEVQWHAAREQPPHLVTLVSSAATGRIMEDWPYRFGKFAPYWLWWLHTVSGRTLQDQVWGIGAPSPIDWDRIFRTRPLRDADKALGNLRTAWQDWLEHNTFDDYWQPTSLKGHFHKIDLPVLHITGWYDDASFGAFFFYNEMLAHSPAAEQQWLIVGPWDHSGTRRPERYYGQLDFTDAALLDINALHLRWFDYWLKGVDNGQAVEPTVTLFLMGENRWRSYSQRGLPNHTTRTFALGLVDDGTGKQGVLTETLSSSTHPYSTYIYDPEQPTPSRDPALAAHDRTVQLDLRYAEGRADVLLYTSAAFEQAWSLIGSPILILFASSDCVDTDFMAALSIVQPNGELWMLGVAVMRASYRTGSENPQPIIPDEIYQYKLEFPATGVTLLPGQRLRLMLMSSWYPAYDLNPNTGARQGEDSLTLVARQMIWHTDLYCSVLRCPVV